MGPTGPRTVFAIIGDIINKGPNSAAVVVTRRVLVLAVLVLKMKPRTKVFVRTKEILVRSSQVCFRTYKNEGKALVLVFVFVFILVD